MSIFTFIYCNIITPVALSNIFIVSFNYHFIPMVKKIEVLLLCNFEVYNTILLTVTTMFCIRSQIYLQLQACPLKHISSILPALLLALIFMSLSTSLAFRFHMISYGVCSVNQLGFFTLFVLFLCSPLTGLFQSFYLQLLESVFCLICSAIDALYCIFPLFPVSSGQNVILIFIY